MKFRKFPLTQRLTKLRNFMRESRKLLFLFLSLLLLTVVDVAALTYIRLVFEFAVCSGAKPSHIVVNVLGHLDLIQNTGMSCTISCDIIT